MLINELVTGIKVDEQQKTQLMKDMVEMKQLTMNTFAQNLRD